MDMSTVKYLTTPDGPVMQITDSSGNILWKTTYAVDRYTNNGGANSIFYLAKDATSTTATTNLMNLKSTPVAITISGLVTIVEQTTTTTVNHKAYIKLNGFTTIVEDTSKARVEYQFSNQTFDIPTLSSELITFGAANALTQNKGEISICYNSSTNQVYLSKTINNSVPRTMYMSNIVITAIYPYTTVYRELEYIKFSGTEYINMGYQPTNATEFGLQVKFPSDLNVTAYNGKGYMGVRNRYAIGHNNDGTYFFGLGNWVTTNVQCDNDWHELRIRPDGFTTNVGYYIDGTWTNPGNVSFVNGGTGALFIGAANSSNGASDYIVQDVKYSEIIEGNITHQLIPCQRKSDGVCGLFNLYNNYFFPMQGTNITTTAAGPTADESPSWSPLN